MLSSSGSGAACVGGELFAGEVVADDACQPRPDGAQLGGAGVGDEDREQGAGVGEQDALTGLEPELVAVPVVVGGS